MTTEQGYDTACGWAEKALRELARWRLKPSPENYRLWYAHLAGENPALSKAIEALLAAGEPVDESRCAELHERFFVHADEERTVLRAGQRLSALASELTHEMSAFGQQTARYGSSLSEAGERVGAAPSPDRIRPILDGIVAETARMQDHTDRIESHLRASMAEVEGLRRDLQAAWSEARTDALTGLANRKHFDQALRIAATQASQPEAPACLMLADIDHFKRFNDLYGHLLGDQVLKLVAGVLRQNVKGQDLVARYGGEEFAVILPATRLADAWTLADRLRDLVASRQIQLKDSSRTLGRVTLSIGVTEFRAGETCAEWTARSDAALYEAKRGGRNQVVARAATDRSPAGLLPHAVALAQHP
jgi:diguanylate cyclase